LGIAQKQVRIKFSHKPRKWQTSSPTSIQTVGDWIRVKRRERNLTRYHLATKMGIATKLLRSWEYGTSRPDRQQLLLLANGLMFDLAKENDFDYENQQWVYSLIRRTKGGFSVELEVLLICNQDSVSSAN
jgi:transcriptional regulator with XRE-family HTH domain